uniref:chitin-binding lectin 1-like n=1 Tax=Ciona intestinalis TaxID=7719 RepID=UPI000EF49ED0
MKFPYSLCVTLLIAAATEGLICLTCYNARNLRQCRAQGSVRLCQRNQKSCQTQIRTDPHGILITKECKQARACANNYAQNPRSAWNPTQCSRHQGSVCTCCCGTDRCNFNSLFCPIRPSTTTLRPTSRPTTRSTTTTTTTTTTVSPPPPPQTTAPQPPPPQTTAPQPPPLQTYSPTTPAAPNNSPITPASPNNSPTTPAAPNN